ncbi:MAG: hypothetical protein PHR98_03575 [Candidatus Shapirobacteria bacterium]|jgi:hypothetical protein|nr:hypothetical protein [Candidatus Shapirobacteria bacterium]
MKTTIQVPVEKDLKVKYEKITNELGYSSLQEYIRVFLKQNLINSKIEYLNSRQELKLEKMVAASDREIKKGNFIKSSNVDELMAYLNSG